MFINYSKLLDKLRGIEYNINKPVVNKYVLATKMTADAVVSHHSAMEYHGFANQVSYRVTVTSDSRMNNVEFDVITYHNYIRRNKMNDQFFREKADALKKELKHTRVFPKRYVKFSEDSDAFQGIRTEVLGEVTFPIELKKDESIILDFGRHCVGYLHYRAEGESPIVDSPLGIEFAFGEFPLEIVREPHEYKGRLGKGWIQRELKKTVFLPAEVVLERRYAFRYVKLTRMENEQSKIFLKDLFADAVSAVEFVEAKNFDIPDPSLQKIYNASLATLKECEQDVFEDGPKRDRRLWIGDLRLQAMSDYVSFGNTDLIKKCIYLFAAHRVNDKVVAPCVFPDSPPYIDKWYFKDYSLYFVSCLLDYLKSTGDHALPEELYEVAREQICFMKSLYEKGSKPLGASIFVDWCPDLDKSTAELGIYLYVLNQFKELSSALGRDETEFDGEFERAKKQLLALYSEEIGLFVSTSGQISWHSQIWAVLSGVLTKEVSRQVLDKIKDFNTEYTMRTPYMIHYYIEALFSIGEKEYAMEYIKNFWMQMLDCGYDCCPEVFNPNNQMESPYGAPEINSACHAWSCTPIYWIYQYYHTK